MSSGRVIDALLHPFGDVGTPSQAFDVAEGLLWLAFRDRCGYPSRGAERAVLVEAEPTTLPREAQSHHLGGNRWKHRMAMATRERMADTDPPPIPMDCAPRVESAAELSAVQRRVLSSLRGSDAFWCVDSDLLGVYGLPLSRAELASMLAAQR